MLNNLEIKYNILTILKKISNYNLSMRSILVVDLFFLITYL